MNSSNSKKKKKREKDGEYVGTLQLLLLQLLLLPVVIMNTSTQPICGSLLPTCPCIYVYNIILHNLCVFPSQQPREKNKKTKKQPRRKKECFPH